MMKNTMARVLAVSVLLTLSACTDPTRIPYVMEPAGNGSFYMRPCPAEAGKSTDGKAQDAPSKPQKADNVPLDGISGQYWLVFLAVVGGVYMFRNELKGILSRLAAPKRSNKAIKPSSDDTGTPPAGS